MWIFDGKEQYDYGFKPLLHRQKTVLLGRKLAFQWVGSYLNARKAFNIIRKSRKNETKFDPEKSIYDGMTADEIESIALNVCWIKGKEIFLFGMNTETIETSEYRESLGGVGSFLRSEHSIPADINIIYDDIESLLFKPHINMLCRLYQGEVGAFPYRGFRSGAWYEITVMNNGQFEKYPYCVVFWDAKDIIKGAQNFHPRAFFSSLYYKEFLLYIVTLVGVQE
ncbi:MAG: hypothetical protein AAGE18_03150 [Pseudomonadota bacterium]